jgi:amino acid transporter
MSVATRIPEPLAYAAEDATSGLKRHLGPVGLLFAGVGSIIGSGWLFGAFNATRIAGPVAIFAWCSAAS